MSSGKLKFKAFIVLFIAVLAIAVPAPVLADGGPIVSRDLWEYLKEGQQIAVVTINDRDLATIDLFISLLDTTDESHEVTFFVPLGKNASQFNAVERDLSFFDEAVTNALDKKLRDGATNRQRAVQALFSGALMTNGSILVPLWAPLLLTGCAAANPKPEATLQTESSRIDIYGIDNTTDVNALIETTGLPGSVADTLDTLKGQQVAVVKLNTKPAGTATENPSSSQSASNPGLLLTWNTSLVPSEAGNTYTYPLGTGAAWSKPIELTRVYISVPRGLDFDVQYPALGTEHAGFDIINGSNILQYLNYSAYAIDETRGDFGRVWRATYTQSNPTDNIIITVKRQSAVSGFFATLEGKALGYSIPFALVIGVLVWVLAWHLLMPRFLGKDADYRLPGWWQALIYPAVNLILIIFPGSVLYLFFLLGLTWPALIVQFLAGGGISIGLFALIHGGHLGVSTGRAIRAFVLTSLCGSAAYLALALAFAKFVSAI